jgi:hypothetical protein
MARSPTLLPYLSPGEHELHDQADTAYDEVVARLDPLDEVKGLKSHVLIRML